MSQAPERSLPRLVVHSALARLLPPLAMLVVVLLAWDGLVRWGVCPAFVLPPPDKVFSSLCREWPELSAAAWSTATAALLGFAASILLGGAIAVLMASSVWARRALYPYAVFFQTVPIVAIAPLLVIWSGYGRPTVIRSAFMVSLFPIVANTLVGLRSTDPQLLDLFRLYGAGRLATLLKLRLPSALPSIFSGLRVGGGLAVIGAIVGEFIAGSGSLGDVITKAITQQRNAKVFAAVLLASLLGLGLFGAINTLAWLFLHRWHASERQP